jgi:hypothetical protein
MLTTRGSKLALVLAVTLFLAAVAGIALAATAAGRAGGGTVRIAVHEQGGDDIRIAVPGFVVGLALALAPDDALAGSLKDARPWLEIARVAVAELGDAGDFTLVSVVKREERVTIRTEGGVLVVDVNEHGNQVRIEMPLRTVERVVRRLDRAAERASARAGEPGRPSRPDASVAPEAPAAGAAM